MALPCLAETVRGVYGVPALETAKSMSFYEKIVGAGVNAVFVPPDQETIKWFKERGFRVFVSMNVFGGRAAWTRYPDARPVKADGTLLGTSPSEGRLGGVCPSHPGWRRNRLAYIANLIERFGNVGDSSIDGIWLDFIRYPGLWERPKPVIPDTCYCPRCLKRFQADAGIDLPQPLTPQEAAGFIKKNHRYRWMQWKKRQIRSFVEDARQIIDDAEPRKRLLLGLFVVPWTKGERRGAESYLLAQDTFELAQVADVVSPMLYHKMSGQPPLWTGYMTRYYAETIPSLLWPIVQTIDCTDSEIRQVSDFVSKSGAHGILAFRFDPQRPDRWSTLAQFRPPANLIPNPRLLLKDNSKWPTGWSATGPVEGRVKPSRHLVKNLSEFEPKNRVLIPREKTNSIGIEAGNDRHGIWTAPLPAGEANTKYRFTARVYRDRQKNREYARVRIWGKEFLLNTNFIPMRFQSVRLDLEYSKGTLQNTFQFINDNTGTTFWLTQPQLNIHYDFDPPQKNLVSDRFFKDVFPLGVYGAKKENLVQIKNLGFNTVIISGNSESVKDQIVACHNLGLNYVISVSRDPERLEIFLDQIAEAASPSKMAFYVNDEPGIWDFPVNRAEDINRIIKARFPKSATCMAVVRPQVCRDYRNAADFFMMDQYPIPSMPMTWLSNSLDQAGSQVGRERLAAVIQAFGGKEHADAGWPRRPTWREMDCLAFLSLIHDARGLFFFTYHSMGDDEAGRKSLQRVLQRIKYIQPWLTIPNHKQQPGLKMISENQFDPAGNAAVHCAVKTAGEKILLLAVNTIGTHVAAEIDIGDWLKKNAKRSRQTEELKSGQIAIYDLFNAAWYPVINGKVRLKFLVYEARVLELNLK